MNYEERIGTTCWQYLSGTFNQLYPEFDFQNRKNKSYLWNNNASDEISVLLNLFMPS